MFGLIILRCLLPLLGLSHLLLNTQLIVYYKMSARDNGDTFEGVQFYGEVSEGGNKKKLRNSCFFFSFIY